MKKTQTLIVAAVITAVAAGFILHAKKSASEGTAAGPGMKGRGWGRGNTVISVMTQVLKKETLHDFVITNGEVESQNSVSVYPDNSGKIISTQVILGSTVKKGDIIAYIDPATPGTFYKQSPVAAPISGSIISTPLKNGTTVSVSTAITQIGDISNLQVTASIPERYVAVLKKGLKADVSVEAYPGTVFKATVSRVSPVVDAASRTKQVILTFDKTDSRINAGMFAKLKLFTEDFSGYVTMPADSIISYNDEFFAYVVKEDSTVEKRKVTTGKNVDGTIQITSGLNEGETVVIQGQTSLSDGASVIDVNKKKVEE